MNVVLPQWMPFLHNILTISVEQLLWIIYKAPVEIKVATLKFWLENATTDQLEVMQDVLVASKSQQLLIYVFLLLKDHRSPVATRWNTLLTQGGILLRYNAVI